MKWLAISSILAKRIRGNMDIYSTFEKSLVRAIKSIFDELGTVCEVIVSHGNGPEPAVDYCMINTLRFVRTGRAQSAGGALEFVQNSLKEYSVQHYEAVVQINFYGKKAAENAMDYYSQFSGNTVIQEHYQRNNLTTRRISDLRRSPQLRETRWVNSFAFDITLGFAVQTIQNVDWVDYITVNGTTIPLSE